jgi:3-hydroxyacyl-[acyl-carrier-protein] dehydratase
MRFRLVDQIQRLEPGQRIVTIKALSLAEEYLADHFPRFPVMPGVLMLEAMTEAGAWLVRVTDEFSQSMITLQRVQNLRFRSFVSPGERLTVSARFSQRTVDESELIVEGKIDDRAAASGRLKLNHYNLSDSRPELVATDQAIKRHFQEAFQLLYQPSELAPA